MLLAAFYIRGSFDRVLYPLGLNAHECARNGLGVTFCGSELTQYREHLAQAKQQGEAAVQRLHASEHAAQQERETAEAITRGKERRSLEEKMAAEKAIFEKEPEDSYSSDLARDEYEAARAQLQQLGAR